MKKTWIDTNIIISFLTADHPVMTPETIALMKKAEEGEIQLKVAPLIVAECCWVLQSPHYGFSSAEIAEVLLSFLNAEGLIVEEKEVVLRALEQYAAQHVDFIDAYLAEHAKAVGLGQITTYNSKDFSKLLVPYSTPSEIV